MAKTIFIVAGFKHSANEKQYDWMKAYFKSKGFVVKVPDMVWSNKVMTDYVSQFVEYYNIHKTETNYLLGFSFGAMTALISASSTKPDKLYLCSLSPYFVEDLSTLKKSWQKSIGHRRITDFAKYSAINISKSTKIPTTIYYGDEEGKKYPQLKIRCEEAHKHIKSSKLIQVKGAPHEIDFPSYIEAIKAEVK